MPSARPLITPIPVAEYIAAQNGLDPALDIVHRRTEELGMSVGMLIAPEVGSLLTILCSAMEVTFAIEIGTFTGYSAVCIARGMANGSKLLTCEVDESATSVARHLWTELALADRIIGHVGDATDAIRELPEAPAVDFAFMDGDKLAYATYYELLVPRLRTGGVLVVDNTLRWGSVSKADSSDLITRSLRDFNDRVATDNRVRSCLLPISDGISIIQKI